MKEMAASKYNTKLKWTRKKEGNEINNVSPKKTKRSKSIVKLPSVKNINFTEHNKFNIGEILGEGAFAKVRLAHRKSDGLKCVIKMYEKNRLKTQERKISLIKEIEVLKKAEHQTLIKLLQSYETTDTYNIVMEYFSDCSLSDFIKIHRPLKNDLLQKITKQIAEGLFYLHKHGMAHRDIKPDNILINSQHKIKIIDLGFAMRGDQIEVKIAGTPQYMCPELKSKKSFNPFKADVWAFGIMLYWLALGYFPQDADQKKKKSFKKVLKVRQSQDCNFELNFPVDMNPGLEYLITKMLNFDPDERTDAKQILQDTWVKPKCLKFEIEKLRQSKKFVEF